MAKAPVEAAKNGLVDAIRDEILDLVQDIPSAFDKLSEQAQATYIEKAALIATSCVRQSCDIIAADGRTLLDCTIGKIDINETTYTAKISVPKELTVENRMALVTADHGPAKLAFVDTKKHLEEHNRPEPKPDQNQLFNSEPKHVGDVLPKLKAVSTTVEETPVKKPRTRRTRTTRSTVKARGKDVAVEVKHAPKAAPNMAELD